METLSSDGDCKKDLDDSGCVQDVGPLPKQMEFDNRPPELMDLSDDVLLYILRYCRPHDLKALGYCCPRLGRLVRDRTLWVSVDARSCPTSRARLRWMLAHGLSKNTTSLLLSGFAREAKGCLGHVNRKRKEVEEEKAMRERMDIEKLASTANEPGGPGTSSRPDGPVHIIQMDPLNRLQQLYAAGGPRFSGNPSWPDDGPEYDPEAVVTANGGCCGPQFTLTPCMLRQLRSHCSLTELALQYCNINCSTTGIAHFPPTLKSLSLRGAKCYNLPLEKSFLFNIQDYLPNLENLELSECEWLEPASLLPLSKVAKLRHLVMCRCYRLSEFVAYASLATRYGFRKLEVLDIRGSPVADSEVCALGWLPALQELYVSPARQQPSPLGHSHYSDEPLPAHVELEPWEVAEPDYFKIKPQIVEPLDRRPGMTVDDIEEHIEQLRDYENNICLHGTEYNLCTEGIVGRKPQRKRPADLFPPETPAKKEHRPSSSSSNEPEQERDNTGDFIVLSRVPGRNTMVQSTSLIETISSVVVNEPPCKKVKSTDASDEKPSSSKLNSDTKMLKSNNDSEMPLKPNNDSKMPLKPNNDSTMSSKLNNDGKIPSKSNSDSQSSSKSGTNTSSTYKKCKSPKKSEDSDSSDDDDAPTKLSSRNSVNDGASTSKSPPKVSGTTSSTSNCTCKKPVGKPRCGCSVRRVYEFVRINDDAEPANPEPIRGNEVREEEIELNRNVIGDREIRPRAHVLYVNVGQQLHTVYRLSIHNEPPIFYSFAGNNHLRFRPNVGNIFYTHPTPHLDATSLVSDSAVRRFGRADVDDVNYIHIGPREGAGDPGARPDRSSLRVLSITGFRNITDRSLMHLATAAPYLRILDFNGTRVTAQGVENFRSLRPDCKVFFSAYQDRDVGDATDGSVSD